MGLKRIANDSACVEPNIWAKMRLLKGRGIYSPTLHARAREAQKTRNTLAIKIDE
jgi:hypothetical protein